MLVLLSSSVRYRLVKVKGAVEQLQEQNAAILIKRQAYFEDQFFASLVEELNDSSCRADLVKDVEIRLLLDKTLPTEVKLYEGRRFSMQK